MLAANMQHVVHHLSGETPSFEVMMFKELLISLCAVLLSIALQNQIEFFLTFFSNCISSIALCYDQILLVGDLNIHINDPNNSFSSDFFNYM